MINKVVKSQIIIDYVDGSLNQACNPDADECYISCSGNRACFNKEYTCPTGANCQKCELECTSGDDVCRLTTIHGNGCDVLNITASGCNYCAQGIQIYAPYNLVLVTNNELGLTGDSSLRYAEVYSGPFTQNISVTCLNTDISAGNECSDMIIHGAIADNVDINCAYPVSCEQTIVYCPISTNTNNCDISCDNTQHCEMDVIITDTSWKDDLSFTCTDGTDCELTVYCGDTVSTDNQRTFTSDDYCKITDANPNKCGTPSGGNMCNCM